MSQARAVKQESNQPGTKNLLPYKWRKGQSGNPKGRPKNENAVSVLLRRSFSPQQILAEYKRLIHCGEPAVEARVLAMLHERIEGKVPQQVEGVEGGAPVKVVISQAFVPDPLPKEPK